eukprot:CAMPEP_0206528516 /NCGR_PEP_ID=MMETSP0325_2-20121206/2023_1 /ASSEMBLY_ACC=CAM_ASM_000347 /TAXON_ID=2866 /ORGANISM="Crypthecodinium cohnii, Strain Seligo" /LENGTH=427 /DNA_ID=CAMNT_0054024197 /DNA_START=116 /DNA_END=1399 /DNA_ORIENTATION=-
MSFSASSLSSMSDDESLRATPVATGTMQGTKAQSADQTKAAESKLSKVKTRLMFGTPMIFGFFLLVWLGHPYMVLLVCLLQVGLFRELVNVRYRPAKERHVPLFRTCQWAMFAVAMCHVYGRVFVNLGLAHSLAERVPAFAGAWVLKTIKYYRLMTFSGYVVTFCGLVLSLRPGLYKYQIGNTVWTVGVLGLVVWQIQGTTELIFSGLVWFMLPCGLVVANDCWAYFCGVAAGRKLIKAPFLALSPNKTWEGFIGGFICTAIWGWWYADVISRSEWLVCPQRNMDPFAHLDCNPDPLFQVQQIPLPSSDFALFHISAKPFQLHAFVLSVFASVVAPFGGFLASAIKRAYNIKDFDSLIPGHGGFMDRMDCQFLMLLCTNVHYKTFVQAHGFLGHQDILGIIRGMAPAARDAFLTKLFSEFNCSASCG